MAKLRYREIQRLREVNAELVAACEALLIEFEHVVRRDTHLQNNLVTPGLFERARDAIAKARGNA